MNDSIVYVLGAGCSVSSGYPLAAGFITSLEHFRQTLGEDPQKGRLKSCVDETVKLMRQAGVQTIDDLTFRIFHKVLDDPRHGSSEAYAVRLQRVRRAKIATAALLLDLEQKSKSASLDSYHRLILSMFPGSGNWQQRARSSNVRLLSFNYDRLFEMALLRAFRVETKTQLLYGEDNLNSGLNHAFGESTGFADGRFCFLKLHGSVGMRVHEDTFGVRYYPHFDGELPGDPIELTDARFMANENHPNPYERDPEPLIVFPWEKDFVLSGADNRLGFREYISTVWKKAQEIVSSAAEIRFIGYSFHQMDHHSVIGLLKQAERTRRCKKLVIQNRPGEAEQICKRLRAEHGISIPLEPYGCEF